MRLNCIIQSNFNGSNTFGTMKICSRQGLFEQTRVDYRARSRSIIWSSFRFSSNKSMLCVLIRIASSWRFLCVHTTYIFKVNKRSRIIPNNICRDGKKLWTLERVRNSRGNRVVTEIAVVRVRAIKVSVMVYPMVAADAIYLYKDRRF